MNNIVVIIGAILCIYATFLVIKELKNGKEPKIKAKV